MEVSRMQRGILIRLVAFAAIFAYAAAAESVRCEQFRDGAKLCLMNNYTVLASNDITMTSRRNEIEEIVFTNNKNVKFLPIRLHQTFPSLREIIAGGCSITNISRSNFDKLNKLQKLVLANNQLQTIRSDTFRDLVRLKELDLAGNSLNILNGRLFLPLPSLKSLSLDSNVCISQNFENASVQTISDEVDKKCKFEEEENAKDPGLICETVSPLYTRGEWCFLNGTTTINKKDEIFHFILDPSVNGLYFNENKKIEYLPIATYRSFPNLEEYQANDCAIKEISRKNFEKLYKLSYIRLHHNQIEKITSDTFADLPLLRGIALNRNRIKHLNSKFLEHFEALNYLDLGNNECIQKTFEYIDSDIMAGFIDEGGCGFDETVEPPFENLLNTTCGTVSFATGLIVHGTEAKKGQWPFLVGLFALPTKKFFCGSSLISSKHILTAAHCIHPKNFDNPLDYKEIAALLGHHNLGAGREEGSVTRLLSKAIIHPEWNPAEIKYNADLAVLVMNREVEFSSFIQPVCLTTEPEIQQYNDGYVVGWGKSENSGSRTNEKIPRQASIRAVKSEICFEKDPPLGNVYSRRSYCAGGEGAGPCSGDSGGGFYVNFDGFWTIRGVVSAGAFNAITLECDVDRYALFTNLFDFSAWIKTTVNGN